MSISIPTASLRPTQFCWMNYAFFQCRKISSYVFLTSHVFFVWCRYIYNKKSFNNSSIWIYLLSKGTDLVASIWRLKIVNEHSWKINSNGLMSKLSSSFIQSNQRTVITFYLVHLLLKSFRVSFFRNRLLIRLNIWSLGDESKLKLPKYRVWNDLYSKYIMNCKLPIKLNL